MRVKVSGDRCVVLSPKGDFAHASVLMADDDRLVQQWHVRSGWTDSQTATAKGDVFEAMGKAETAVIIVPAPEHLVVNFFRGRRR